MHVRRARIPPCRKCLERIHMFIHTHKCITSTESVYTYTDIHTRSFANRLTVVPVVDSCTVSGGESN